MGKALSIPYSLTGTHVRAVDKTTLPGRIAPLPPLRDCS
jgi:hypothetical protein